MPCAQHVFALLAMLGEQNSVALIGIPKMCRRKVKGQGLNVVMVCVCVCVQPYTRVHGKQRH